jgi:hypothetical protein
VQLSLHAEPEYTLQLLTMSQHRLVILLRPCDDLLSRLAKSRKEHCRQMLLLEEQQLPSLFSCMHLSTRRHISCHAAHFEMAPSWRRYRPP